MSLLQIGSRGPEVKSVQQSLSQALPGVQLAPDGIFGGATHNAVVQFQRAKGLVPDGKVGPKTRAVLGANGAAPGMPPGVAPPPAAAPTSGTAFNPLGKAFQQRVAAFIAAAIQDHGVTIPQKAEFRRAEDAQKWHVAHMMYYNSYQSLKPAQSESVNGRSLIAWSHLQNPALQWQYVRWQDYLRDKQGAVPVKVGDAWSPGKEPDKEQSRKQALSILKSNGIATAKDRPTEYHSAMVAPGYHGCGAPCSCGGGRSKHIAGMASDLGRTELELLSQKLRTSGAGDLDTYLRGFGLHRPMSSEPWHVEATTP